MMQYRSIRKLACLALLLPVLGAAGAADDINDLELAPPPSEPDVVNELEVPEAGSVAPAVVSYPEPEDPWEGFNRGVFAFNHGLYVHALIPSARAYRRVVPQPVRTRVGMVFGNLREPLYSISHVVRGDMGSAGGSIMRFLTNSTIGVLGLFDPAEHWLGLESEPARFDEGLSRVGVPRGPYLVLPLLGPGDVRGGSAGVGEALLHPLNFLLPSPESAYAQGAGRFQEFAPRADSYETLYESSEDPYRYFRNQYMQGVTRDDELGRK